MYSYRSMVFGQANGFIDEAVVKLLACRHMTFAKDAELSRNLISAMESIENAQHIVDEDWVDGKEYEVEITQAMNAMSAFSIDPDQKKVRLMREELFGEIIKSGRVTIREALNICAVPTGIWQFYSKDALDLYGWTSFDDFSINVEDDVTRLVIECPPERLSNYIFSERFETETREGVSSFNQDGYPFNTEAARVRMYIRLALTSIHLDLNNAIAIRNLLIFRLNCSEISLESIENEFIAHGYRPLNASSVVVNKQVMLSKEFLGNPEIRKIPNTTRYCVYFSNVDPDYAIRGADEYIRDVLSNMTFTDKEAYAIVKTVNDLFLDSPNGVMYQEIENAFLRHVKPFSMPEREKYYGDRMVRIKQYTVGVPYAIMRYPMVLPYPTFNIIFSEHIANECERDYE